VTGTANSFPGLPGFLGLGLLLIPAILSALAPALTKGVQESLPELVEQGGHSSSVDALAFTPDSRQLVSAGHDSTIRLWDVSNGVQIRVLGGHNREIDALAICPNGRCVASGGWDTALKIWELPGGRLLKSFVGHTGGVHSVVFTADGSKVISGAGDPPDWEGRKPDLTVRVWDAKTGRSLQTLEGFAKHVISVDLSPDGKWLVSGSMDGMVRIWDLRSGRMLRSIQSAEGKVYAHFTFDGCCIVSSGKGRIDVWDAASGRWLRRLAVDPRPYITTLNPTRPQVAYASEHLVKLLDLQTGRLVASFAAEGKSLVESIAISPDGRWLASGYVDGTILLWDLATRALTHELRGYTSPVESLAQSVDGRWIASGTDQFAVNVWDTASGRLLRTVKSENRQVHALAFSPDGHLLATGGGDPTDKVQDRPIEIWDLRTGTKRLTLMQMAGRVQSLVFSPDGRWLGAAEGTRANIWDLTSHRVQVTLSPVNRVLAFGDGGRWVATGSTDQSFTVWDSSTGRILSRLPRVGWAHSISPNGRWMVALGGYDHATLWDLSSRRSYVLQGHRNLVHDAAFSHDGKFVATCGWDGQVLIWDLESHRLLRSLSRQNARLDALAFTVDGKGLLSAGYDGRLQLWDLDSGREALSMLALRDGRGWLVVAPDGLFDGTAEAMARVAWRFGRSDSTVTLESFFADFYRPGLLSEVTAGERPHAKLDIVTLSRVPGLRSMLAEGRARLETRGDVTLVCFADLPGAAVEFPPGANDIPAQKNDVEVLPDGATCKYRMELRGGEALALSPRTTAEPASPWDGKMSAVDRSVLHVMTIGVGSYPGNSGFDPLPYAAPSAKALRDFFVRQNMQPGRGYASIRIWPGLYDQEATQEAIRRRLRQIAQTASDNDVVLLYLGGHGLVTPREEMFYFVPSDGSEQAIRQTGFSTAMLAEDLRGFAARRLVLVIDTCQSGGAVEALRKIGEAKARQAVRYARLDPTARASQGIGVHIIAAALPLAYAVQVKEDRSALVATILDALQRGPSLTSVGSLVQRVKTALPAASEKAVGFRQVPLTDSVGLDFLLGVN
jgi:WD40 repeat protein